jgi:hypothetical protein
MNTHDVQICAILRNFKSDTEYLHFGDFWIEKLREEDRDKLCKDLNYFDNYWGDNYIAVRDYYIGRGKSSDFLSLNSRVFFFPLFRMMKLFKRGDLIIPLLFAYANNKWHEMRFHGDSYGLGCWLGGDADTCFFEKKDIETFNIFRREIGQYLKYINFPDMPYRKKHKAMSDIDTRCFLAIHVLLKGSVEHHNPFPVIDTLIDYTIALESLYLLRGEDKRQNLSSRIATLLSKDKSEEKQICRNIKKFYDIRSDIVHGSLMDEKGYEFLCENIYEYEDYLRKSILAFLDLNLRNPSKKVVLGIIDKAILDSDLRKEIQESLNILKLAI